MSTETPKVKQLTAQDFILCECGCGQYIPPPRSPEVQASYENYLKLATPCSDTPRREPTEGGNA
jgi:hypothetical protein